MPSIFLTDFVDFVVATGTSKLTKVRQIKRRPQYHPAFDHWKILRDGIVDFHATGNADRAFFDRLLAGMTDVAKRTTYQPLVTNYKRFLGRKTIVSQPSDQYITWTYKDLEVRINPELRLKLPKTAGASFCLLDVNNLKPYISTNPSDDNLPLLYGEADSFLTMWNYV